MLSLEVGEHVPSQHEAVLIRNLHALNCRGIILSWASLWQSGHGHVRLVRCPGSQQPSGRPPLHQPMPSVQGYSPDPRWAPSPRGRQREVAVVLWCLPKSPIPLPLTI